MLNYQDYLGLEVESSVEIGKYVVKTYKPFVQEGTCVDGDYIFKPMVIWRGGAKVSTRNIRGIGYDKGLKMAEETIKMKEM